MSTKIHAVVVGNARPKARGLSPGQAADCTVAETLLADIEADMTVIADIAYDTNAILDHLADEEAIAVIPSTSNRTEPQLLGPAVYATRNLVELFFGGIKEFQRVATRCDR